MVLLLFWYRRRRRKTDPHPQDVLQAEFGPNNDGGSPADSSAHLTPFRVFDSVITRPSVAPPPPLINMPPASRYSPAQTSSSLTQSPRQPSPGPPPGPRLVVYNADGVSTEPTPLSDVLEEKRRLAIRERDRQTGRLQDSGPVTKLVSRIRNSAGQLPPDYHLATQPPTPVTG